mgnify:CR=1 FL=1
MGMLVTLYIDDINCERLKHLGHTSPKEIFGVGEGVVSNDEVRIILIAWFLNNLVKYNGGRPFSKLQDLGYSLLTEYFTYTKSVLEELGYELGNPSVVMCEFFNNYNGSKIREEFDVDIVYVNRRVDGTMKIHQENKQKVGRVSREIIKSFCKLRPNHITQYERKNVSSAMLMRINPEYVFTGKKVRLSNVDLGKLILGVESITF